MKIKGEFTYDSDSKSMVLIFRYRTENVEHAGEALANTLKGKQFKMVGLGYSKPCYVSRLDREFTIELVEVEEASPNKESL